MRLLESRNVEIWGEGVQFKANQLSVGIEEAEVVATDVLEEATPVSIDTDHARLGAARSDYPGGQAISVESYSRASTAVLRVGEHGNQEEMNSVRVPKKWSDPTILSLVLFAANDGGNSGTGVRPLEYLVGEDVLVTEYVLEQVNAHTDRSDAESLICIEVAIGGEPQRNVTSVESTPGVLACSSKWIQRVSSGDGHEPAEGSDLTTFYFGDKLAERDLDVGQLELEPQTSLDQRLFGTQAARRSSVARNSISQIGRFDYSEWTSASGQGLHAAPLDRHGGTVERG